VKPGHRTGIKKRRRQPAAWAGIALLSLALALALLPAAAAADTRAPLATTSTLQLPPAGGSFPDSLVHGTRRLNRLDGDNAGSYPVLGGQQVEISTTYYSDADMQSIANVLGGLVHGDEMNSLSVYVASPDEISQICGPQALACYAPSSEEMIVSGVDGSAYGVPRDYTIAHEYGHHIANNRVNGPWTALDTGAKRWATYEHVCQGTRKGQLFPGDEDAHYWDNPGEGFAESNAHMNFPAVSVPWGYNSLLRPTQASLAKLRGDIVSPWSQPTTVTWNGSLWPGRSNPAAHRFATPLDGQVQISLSGPAGSNYDLYVLGPKLQRAARLRKHRRAHRLRPRRRIVGRAVSSGSEEQLGITLCGQSSIRVEVRRRSGSGPFTVSVTRP
jgi:hypothetical protein